PPSVTPQCLCATPRAGSPSAGPCPALDVARAGGSPFRQEPAPGLSTSSTWSTALHQRHRTDSIVSLSTLRSSTLGSPARSRWTYSTTFDERVTSKRVRLPQREQRHRVEAVGRGTVIVAVRLPSSVRDAPTVRCVWHVTLRPGGSPPPARPWRRGGMGGCVRLRHALWS